MSSTQKKVILLSLEDYSYIDDLYADFFAALQSKCELIRIENISSAHEALNNGDIAALLVYESSIITNSKSAAVEKFVEALVEFTRNGGNTVFACNCSSFVSPSELESFFSSKWKLPWQMSSYSGGNFKLNDESEIKLGGEVASKYSMKAVHLSGVASKDLMYVPDTGEGTGEIEGPVALTLYGQGRLGWVGDVNNERETTPLVLAMLGL